MPGSSIVVGAATRPSASLTWTTGPVVDEQAGEADGLGQRAAAVAAQVEDHGVDALVG